MREEGEWFPFKAADEADSDGLELADISWVWATEVLPATWRMNRGRTPAKKSMRVKIVKRMKKRTKTTRTRMVAGVMGTRVRKIVRPHACLRPDHFRTK